MKPQKADSTIIRPLIQVAGEKHALQKIYDGEKKPVLKAIGYAQLKEGNNWVSYVVTFQGDKVLSIEVDEPNLRQIAEESSKISFVTTFQAAE